MGVKQLYCTVLCFFHFFSELNLFFFFQKSITLNFKKGSRILSNTIAIHRRSKLTVYSPKLTIYSVQCTMCLQLDVSCHKDMVHENVQLGSFLLKSSSSGRLKYKNEMVICFLSFHLKEHMNAEVTARV